MAEQTFTAGQVLTAAQMSTLQDNIGLNKIASVTYTGSTTASVTAVILGCFTSLYTNYRIVISHAGSASTTFAFQLMDGNTPEAGTVYFGYGLAYAGGAADAGAGSATSQRCGGHSSDSNIMNETVIDLANPQIAKRTQATIHAFDASGPNVLLLGTQVATTTQYSGIRLMPTSGSITGTMTVYGYRK
jgi:hypothetical protein